MVGKTLRKLRLSAGQTQEDVATAVFVSIPAISQYENGRSQPSRAVLEALAKHFNVTPEYLLGTSANPKLEDMMNLQYIPGISVSDLLDMCIRIPKENRQALITVLNALSRTEPEGKQS